MRRHALTALAFPLVSALVASALVPSHAAAKAPVARRYVAILKAKKEKEVPCPQVTGWNQSSLFDPLRVDPAPDDKGPNKPKKLNQPVPKDKAPERPSFDFAALRRFCQYTVAGPLTDTSAPPAHKDFQRVDPDYDVLVPQGSLGQDSDVRDALSQIYRTRLDLAPIAGAQEQPLYTSKDARSVAQVVVIDTVDRTRVVADPRSKHGLAMAEIIREVRCPAREEACRRHLSFLNAFPWRADATGQLAAALPGSSSEPLGSLGSLAQAIYLAVSSWRRDNFVRNDDAPLILNLSLGWDPGVWNEEASDGESPAWAPADWELGPWDIPTNQRDEALAPRKEWPATAQAVHAALVYASCFDVLAVAAAGNNSRGAHEQTGALAPAKWEKLLEPSERGCERLFGAAARRAQRAGNEAILVERRPLVYAVNPAMTGRGGFVPTSRLGSASLQVGPASHVVAGAGANRTDPWSGSSVAAATYSGLAAALWSYDRRLTPHQVMTLIYDTGQSTAIIPTLVKAGGVESPTTKVHAFRPDPSRAFAHLCPTGCGGLANPYVAAAGHQEALQYGPLRQALSQKMTAIPELLAPAPALVAQIYPKAVQRTHYYFEPDAGAAPPLSEAVSAAPWTRPQPQTPICPVCVVSDLALILSLNEVGELKVGDKVVLDNPVLEFRLGNHGFISVSLGELEVTTPGLRVPLDRYQIKLGDAEKGLGTALREQNVSAGTLTIFVKDPQTSEPRANVSVVLVLPQN